MANGDHSEFAFFAGLFLLITMVVIGAMADKWHVADLDHEYRMAHCVTSTKAQ